MWKPIELSVENFVSHYNTHLVFDTAKCYAITGENYDDDGQKSNGSGKSTILDAIWYSLIGSTLRESTNTTDLIHNNHDESQLYFSLYNDTSGDVLEITRNICRSKSSKLSLCFNGDDVKFTSVRHGNELILEYIGLSKEEIQSYYLLASDSYINFLSSTDNGKREIISRLTNVDFIKDIIKSLRTKSKEHQSSNDQLDLNIANIQGQIDILDELINESSESRSKQAIEDEILTINKQLAEIKSEQQNKENALNANNEKKKLVQNKEKELNIKREKYKKELLSCQRTISSIKSKIQIIANKIEGSIDCPKCDHNFVIGENVDDLKNQSTLLHKELIEKTESLKSIKNHIEAFKKNQNQIDVIFSKLENIISSIFSDKTKLSNSLNRLEFKLKELNNEQLSIDKWKDTIQKRRNKKSTLNLQIKQQQDEFESHQKQIDYYNQAQIIYKQFITYITNQCVLHIEGLTNQYLKQIKSSLSIKINQTTIDTRNKVKDKIEVVVFSNGIDKGSYFKLSGGERTRILICNILAFQKLINTKSETGGLNLLFLDEITEKLDELGVSTILNTFDLLDNNIYCITQAIDQSIFNGSVIKIVKRSQYSYIE